MSLSEAMMMSQIELEEFQLMVDVIMRDQRSSEADKRRAIAQLWTGIETDEISSADQYESYKKEHKGIELRCFGDLTFPEFIKSPDGKAFLRSPDGYRWSALGGAMLGWEEGENRK
jgi:hypothetical protein